ncbi:MAG TPA: phage tail tube protein [Phycisphaerales bacterium]|nr:phage tail tube protein [Phycisphaerales bacterium]HMP37040.1 phage tail tube protein [Phycisphaerales bacterium]
MSLVLGLNAKLYRNTGTYASPTWALIGNVKNVTLNLEKGEADVTTRSNNGWRANVGTLKDASIEFQMVWDTDDTHFSAIKDAFLANTPIEFLVLDGPVATAGSQGLRATCDIMSFSRDEQLEEALMVNVTAKPTYSVNAPEWFEVPA